MKNKMFKKVYIEITNICNLSCPFCLKAKRNKRSLTFNEFKHILAEIEDYTDYLYLHVLGEPLVHPDINEFIEFASSKFNINITTNGYLIHNLKSNKVRQINISLHSFDDKYNIPFNKYMDNIFKCASALKENTYINYRLWSHSKYFDEIVKALEEKYNTKISEINGNVKLDNNVFLSFEDEFTWPDDNMDDDSEYTGVCYALKDHVAVLSNGDVVPCCLDGNASLKLGNIFDDNFTNILNSSKFITLKDELSKGIRTSNLCKKCNFSTKRYK